jgi:hypothetical protein
VVSQLVGVWHWWWCCICKGVTVKNAGFSSAIQNSTIYGIRTPRQRCFPRVLRTLPSPFLSSCAAVSLRLSLENLWIVQSFSFAVFSSDWFYIAGAKQRRWLARSYIVNPKLTYLSRHFLLLLTGLEGAVFLDFGAILFQVNQGQVPKNDFIIWCRFVERRLSKRVEVTSERGWEWVPDEQLCKGNNLAFGLSVTCPQRPHGFWAVRDMSKTSTTAMNNGLASISLFSCILSLSLHEIHCISLLTKQEIDLFWAHLLKIMRTMLVLNGESSTFLGAFPTLQSELDTVWIPCHVEGCTGLSVALVASESRAGYCLRVRSD